MAATGYIALILDLIVCMYTVFAYSIGQRWNYPSVAATAGSGANTSAQVAFSKMEERYPEDEGLE